ncbi:Hypothetical predicted protein [Olea europaea subsp. europaea]|uniref:Uncharacterized protein n=1 Tax=Olea europaea subsp. europaea TaxID=158383 RepID=A0A8S0RFU9_OLEEU|nr:Hypothetical predicted protein [Olea europaea subsp. europaea]
MHQQIELDLVEGPGLLGRNLLAPRIVVQPASSMMISSLLSSVMALDQHWIAASATSISPALSFKETMEATVAGFCWISGIFSRDSAAI